MSKRKQFTNDQKTNTIKNSLKNGYAANKLGIEYTTKRNIWKN